MSSRGRCGLHAFTLRYLCLQVLLLRGLSRKEDVTRQCVCTLVCVCVCGGNHASSRLHRCPSSCKREERDRQNPTNPETDRESKKDRERNIVGMKERQNSPPYCQMQIRNLQLLTVYSRRGKLAEKSKSRFTNAFQSMHAKTSHSKNTSWERLAHVNPRHVRKVG